MICDVKFRESCLLDSPVLPCTWCFFWLRTSQQRPWWRVGWMSSATRPEMPLLLRESELLSSERLGKVCRFKGMAGCNFYILRTASNNACYYRRIIMLKLLFHDWYACIIYLFLVSVSVLLLLLLVVVVVVVVAAVLLVVAAAVVVVIMCSKCMGRDYMTIQVRCVCCWNEDIVW